MAPCAAAALDGSEGRKTADAAADPAPPSGAVLADSEGVAVIDDADAGEVGVPASTEPPAIAQASDGRVGTGSGSLVAGQAAGSARPPELIPLTTQSSDGRRGSVGRRASGGSAGLGAGQPGGSELTFGAMLSGKRSASSQGDAALFRLPPVEDDVAAEARLLLCWLVL